MTDDLVLYDSPGSPCGRRVRIALLEKGLRWKTRIVDLARLEQKSDWYLALNPNGVVPTLRHGRRVIFESNVITEYIDQVFPDPPLYPADPWERAQAKMWQAFELEMAKEFRPLMYHRLIGPMERSRPREAVLTDVGKSTADPAHRAWAARVYDGAVIDEAEAERLASLLRGRLDRLEKQLAGRDFLVGARLSIADLSVLPRVAMYPWIGIPIEAARWPGLAAWLARVGTRRSLVESEHPGADRA